MWEDSAVETSLRVVEEGVSIRVASRSESVMVAVNISPRMRVPAAPRRVSDG